MMWSLWDLLSNFFTHKDFLPPADQLPGTMFTPLHLIFSGLSILLLAVLIWRACRVTAQTLRRVYAVVWAVCVVLEIAKIAWEACTGTAVRMEWGGVLPLYPCSIFMYAMPFAIWGNDLLRRAACGYVCTLGLLGGTINFVYPATVLGNYSAISFAGFQTFFYHGAIVFCALTMLLTRYHWFTGVTKWWELLLPSLPFLAVSVPANIVNFSPVNADYMFFKMNSFIFAPIGQATPDVLCAIMVYGIYLVLHALPYIPSYIAHCCRVVRAKKKGTPT